MDSIRIPPRYRYPDPVHKIGTLTYEQQWDLSDRISLTLLGLGVRDGKAFRKRRIVNSFMQIYSVRILDASKEELDQICGRIVAGMVVIFDRLMDKATPHDIDAEGYIRLTGPKYPLDGICDLMFNPRLFRKDKPEHFFHPRRGINLNKWGWPIGDVMIPALDRPDLYGKVLLAQRGKMNRLNELCSDVIHTTCGPVEVTHATFEDAADSFLTIKLVEWRGDGDAANVYGRIVTSDTLMGGEHRARSVAFDLKRDECVRVKPEQYISVHRPVTIVPMGHKLIVEVRLFHNDLHSATDKDKLVVIANGVCSFMAQSAETMDLPVDAPPEPDDDSSSVDDDSSSVDEDSSSSLDEDQAAHQKPATEDQAAHQKPAPEDQAAHQKPATEDQAAHQKPAPEDQAAHQKPAPEDQAAHQKPATEDQAAHQKPAPEDQAAHQKPFHLGAPQTITGEWGTIEVMAYWLPCWCRHYSQLDKEDDHPPFQPTEEA